MKITQTGAKKKGEKFSREHLKVMEHCQFTYFMYNLSHTKSEQEREIMEQMGYLKQQYLQV
jgi:hypothetical protein